MLGRRAERWGRSLLPVGDAALCLPHRTDDLRHQSPRRVQCGSGRTAGSAVAGEVTCRVQRDPT
eukprot:3143365-Prymnesium_polylepis.3